MATLTPKPLTLSWSATICVAIAGLLGACQASPSRLSDATPSASQPPSPAQGALKPRVVATTSIICNLTQQIAADTIDLTCPIKPGIDPHLYKPAPADRQAIEQANLILYSGYHFEPSVIKLVETAPTSVVRVAVAEVAVPNPLPFEEDGKTESDPHVWHNAQNGIRMVESIQRSLVSVAPGQAQSYAQQAKRLTTDLTQIDRWIKTQISTIPVAARKLVTTHDALGYYAKAYGIPIEGALQGISTEEQPTPARVAELVQRVRSSQVPTIFAERAVNPKLLEAIAKDAKVRISDQELLTDGLDEPGKPGATYQGMLITNTQTIVEGLGGRYTPFAQP